MTEEIWKDVPSVTGMMASSLGRIKAKPRFGIMPNGSMRVYQGKAWFGAWAGTRYTMRYHGKTYRVARLVCEAFHGAHPSEKPVCMHLDENARNNNPLNLAWGTQKENLNAPGFIKYCHGRTGAKNPAIKGKLAKLKRAALASSVRAQMERFNLTSHPTITPEAP